MSDLPIQEPGAAPRPEAADGDPEPVLDRLCRHFGILPEYSDLAGETHRPPDSTRRALLAALGAPAHDPETARASLAAARDREWRRALPPVAVLREDRATLELPLALPAATADRPLRWVLRQEDGGTREGRLHPQLAPVAERRTLDGETWVLRRIALPIDPADPTEAGGEPPSAPPLALGYHRLELLADGSESAGEPAGASAPAERPPIAALTLIRVPARCYCPEGLADERRTWGLVTQLYAVRSARNWGMGDFTDLTRLVELTANGGGGVLAISPLHALFPGRPERCNPYAPSSRRFLNVLHIDVEAIPEAAESESAQAELARDELQAMLRAERFAPLVDYPAIARAKLPILERIYRTFRKRHLQDDPQGPRARAFRDFQAGGGEPLRRLALFETIAESLAETRGERRGEQRPETRAERRGDGPAPPPFADWPPALRRASSPAAAEIARERAARVDFYAWLQWHAHQQLATAGRRCLELRLPLGLCQDLAVGAAPDGAEVWSDPDLFLHNVHIGAPPDDFSPQGQDWAVLPWHPVALREAGYAPFAETLRANMRDAGALRIDHAMGLMRLFLIPKGRSPESGAYLAYPFEDLLGVLALESVRNRCLILAEDLGTVPEEVPRALKPLGVLSSRLLCFARDAEGGFLPPAQIEPQSVLSWSTHDLPTLAGFWTGADLEERRALGLCANERAYADALLRRSNDRAHLLLALDREDLLPEGTSADPVAVPELTPAHVRSVYCYLGRSPAQVLLVQTADLLGQTEQVNLPSSADAYPNWRHRQPLELERWPEAPDIDGVLAVLRAERGVAALPALPAEAIESRTWETNGTLRAVIPRATYRLQLHAGFGFAAAAELIPYLARLGISHCYFSPYLKARPGSTHGYDVVAHDRLNPELGSREDYERLCTVLADHDMGQILDMVPNHVGVMGFENGWWMDVLENGPASPFADYFDIDWEPLRREMEGKVLVPVLGDRYGNVLDAGALKLVFDSGAFRVEYYEHRFPIDPREYPRILAPGLPRLAARMGSGELDEGEETLELAAFESLVGALGKLPRRHRTDPAAVAERRRDKELYKQRLAALAEHNADIDRYIGECLRDYNGAEDYPADHGRLHELLEAQAYRLAHWRVAADEINYRRFFDINDLAALRMDDAGAFDAAHALVMDLIGQGRLAGLRIDHPDGLYDPAGYFRRIQEGAAEALHRPPGPGERNGDALSIYLVVEKILMGDEQLPADWPVHGTTGYEVSALIDALLVDPAGAEPLTRCWQAFVAPEPVRPLGEEIYRAKKLVMRNLLSSELHVLADQLSRIAEADPHTRDFTPDGLRDALAEVVACFPVYRTYISEEGPSPRDRHQILKAVSEARRQSDAADLSVFAFVQDVLTTDIAEGKPEPYRERVLRCALKFQQYTGPVTAKGIEDTAFYRWHRLISLNEVGGDPERFGLSVEAFHRAMARRREAWPHGMLTGSTHDSKRSEDVRARLHVLSEIPAEWETHVRRWQRIDRRLRRQSGERTLPDANTEYLLYQTLLGAWPLEEVSGAALDELRGRVRGYMEKAVKEAKVHTAWTNADSEYEAALAAFVDAVLERGRNGAFFEDFLPFKDRVARLGLYNSLSLTLLRLTLPGVPDTYQGTELLSFRLVDPDNRRPVDFERRRALLAELDTALSRAGDLDADLDADPAGATAGAQGDPGGGAADTLASLARDLTGRLADGAAKLYLVHRALTLRRRDPQLFEQGDYTPLAVEGPHADRLVAYARRFEGRAAVVLAPRLLAGLATRRGNGAENGIERRTEHGPGLAPGSRNGADPGRATPDREIEGPLADPFADPGWLSTYVEIPVPTLHDRLAGLTLHARPDHGLPPDPGGPYRIGVAPILRRFPVGLLTGRKETARRPDANERK